MADNRKGGWRVYGKTFRKLFLGGAEQMKGIIHKQAQQIMLREPQNNDII